MKTPKINSKTLTRFFGLQYDKFILIFMLLLIGFGFYVIYTITYTTFISPLPVTSQDITSNQKKLDIGRYESTLKKLQEKNSYSGSNAAPDIF